MIVFFISKFHIQSDRKIAKAMIELQTSEFGVYPFFGSSSGSSTWPSDDDDDNDDDDDDSDDDGGDDDDGPTRNINMTIWEWSLSWQTNKITLL